MFFNGMMKARAFCVDDAFTGIKKLELQKRLNLHWTVIRNKSYAVPTCCINMRQNRLIKGDNVRRTEMVVIFKSSDEQDGNPT